MHRSNTYTFVFLGIVTVVCAGLLAAVSTTLAPRQKENEVVDMKRNILIALTIVTDEKRLSREEVLAEYERSVVAYAVNAEGARVTLPKGVRADMLSLEKEMAKPKEDRTFPVYEERKDGAVRAYAVPLFGAGVWGSIHGYLALNADVATVRGITFNKQNETPGLGAKIVSHGFLANFKGKRIRNDEGTLTSITIVKGAVAPGASHKERKVDGISGATKTGNAVMTLLAESLALYEPFFTRVKEGDTNE